MVVPLFVPERLVPVEVITPENVGAYRVIHYPRAALKVGTQHINGGVILTVVVNVVNIKVACITSELYGSEFTGTWNQEQCPLVSV